MSFTFTVETGAGLASANSYGSVSEMDDYAAVDVNYAASWAAFDSDEKEKRLAWASRVLDQKTSWRGTKAVAESGLRWPRYGVYDRDGNLIADNVVPVQVKQATFELAKFMTATDITTSQEADFIKRIELDVVQIDFQDNTAQPNTPSMLNDILSGLGSFGGCGAGGSRFHRIVKV